MHGIVLHTALFMTFLLLSLILVLANKTRTRQQNPLKPLKKACLANHPEAAREALLNWAKQTWPDSKILNLDDIIQHTPNNALTHALQALSEALYQTKKTPLWQGHVLWLAVQAISKTKRAQSPKASKISNLPPLNPLQHTNR
jgi:hypothetical protein